MPPALAVYGVLAVLLHDSVAVLPSLTLTSGSRMQLAMFVPVVILVALGHCLDGRLPAPEASGVRPVLRLDALLVVTVILAAAMVGMGIGTVLESDAALVLGRNTAFLTGILLCGRAVFGTVAVLLPVLWIASVMLFGFRTWTDPHFWAVLPEPPGEPHAMILAVTALLCGLLVHLFRIRRAL
ncbi:hypothetical protein MTQ01_06975 [Streptomyces sp. XM4193]|uniref:hypothetical protein n=1 Tax=Streptomyces sp. XM4193 TaxID=2929782 RepID=UPI001FF706A6|nr:hypothetical protein [Streptomyces sp. XM4193]MCK1795756.1 hypothetical protein [Streptomyces sp. XM4193]